MELLRAGYHVHATIRSTCREKEVRDATHTVDDHRLSFFVADLNDDKGWAEAARDCIYAHHVASPLPHAAPKHEADIIRPAVDGTTRVLKAARDAGVKRVVLTSSFAAIAYGQTDVSMYTEETRSIEECVLSTVDSLVEHGIT